MSPIPSTLLIGLTGRKRAGKDSFADVLVREYGYTRASFADPLRDAALRLDPIIAGDDGGDVMRLSNVVERHGWEDAKDTFPEVRRTLQRFGTDAIRAIDEEFWVRMAIQGLAKIDGPVVFTDVRFPNEADAIKAEGGFIVRVERQQMSDGDVHPSETAMDDYEVDITITDHGPTPRTLAELQNAARVIGELLPNLSRL